MSRFVIFLFSLFFLTSCSSLYSDGSKGNVIPGSVISKKNIRIVDSSVDENSLNIALLVPLGKQKDSIGKTLIKSAQLAMMHSNRTDVNLTMLDSELLETSPNTLLDKLTEQKIDIVIGPLYGSATKKMISLIGDRKIMVLSLSNDSSVYSDSLLMMGISPDSQAIRITDYAIGQGIERFHLLLPNDKFGQLVDNAVGNLVVDKANISYSTKWYNQHNVEKTIERVVSSVENSPSQAIFMPQGGSNLKFLNDSVEKNKLDKVTLIGLQAWDDPDVLNLPSLNGAILLKKNLSEEQFYDSFLRTFNVSASNIDFITYNSLIMVVNMRRDQLELNKQSIIANNQIFGRYSEVIFNSDAISFYNLSVVKIQDKKFKLVE